MRNLIAAPWLSSGRQALLSLVVAALLVFGVMALLKVNSGAKQEPTKLFLSGTGLDANHRLVQF
jgi:hypothetical protein